MSYYLKRTSQTTWAIQKGSGKIGSVMPSKEQPGQYVGLVNGVKTYGASPSAVFQQIVARLNRIELCGEDDVEKAAAEVARRNAHTVETAAELNKIGAPLGIRVRVRRTGIRIR
jgi:hypothetical protein